jgi:FMN phosphatase YigB (HAD superfamily)
VSGPVYDAVLFDLFGTLVTFDTTTLPEIIVDGRPIRSTVGRWRDLLERALPGVGMEAFARAVLAVSAELDRERVERHVEFPSRERFRRAIVRLGIDGAEVPEMAVLLARAHMRVIAEATRFPPEHARVLDEACRRGPVGIITNFDDTSTAYDILARHGILGCVRTVVVSDAIGLRKPHPALVRVALRELGAVPASPVMVGDHPLEDVGAALAAGIDAIWVDARGAGTTAGNPAPRHVVRALPEILSLLG